MQTLDNNAGRSIRTIWVVLYCIESTSRLFWGYIAVNVELTYSLSNGGLLSDLTDAWGFILY